MGCYVLGFQEIDQTQVAVVGGKGAHLGELSRIEGLRVPAAADRPPGPDRLERVPRRIRASGSHIQRRS